MTDTSLTLTTHHPVTTLIASDSLILSNTPYNKPYHSSTNPLCILVCYSLSVPPVVRMVLVRAPLYNNTDHSLSNPPPPPSVPPVVRMVLVRALKAQVTEAVDAIEALKTVPEVREGMSERRGGSGSEGMRGGERRKGE